MHIRPIRASDLSEVADIGVGAFKDDELFRHLHPRILEYPDSFRRTLLQVSYMRFVSDDVWGFVCVSDSDADLAPRSQSTAPGISDPPPASTSTPHKSKVLGVGWWSRRNHPDHRFTPPPSHAHIKSYYTTPRTLRKKLEQQLRRLEEIYIKAFNMNPSADYSRHAAMRSRADPFEPLKAYEAGYWYLGLLAVAPEHQRKGVGKQLVQWGVQRAREQHVPAALGASPMGRGLYASFGFRVLSADTVEGLVSFGCTMIWDEEGQVVRGIGEGGRELVGGFAGPVPLEVKFTEEFLAEAERKGVLKKGKKFDPNEVVAGEEPVQL